MGDLTKNLSRSEFACKCGCDFDTVDVELVSMIQRCGDHFANMYSTDIKIILTSGNRCREHNETVMKEYDHDYVPYSSKSQHMYARAVDFKLFNRHTGNQIDPDSVATYLEKRYVGRFGIGRYSNRTHFDTRTNGPARWGK